MSPRIKKLIALLGLLPYLVAYMFAAAALGELVPSITILQVPYFIIAGLAWAYPVYFLIRWANAEPKSARDE